VVAGDGGRHTGLSQGSLPRQRLRRTAGRGRSRRDDRNATRSPASSAIAAAGTLLAAARHDRLRWLTKPLLMPALMVGRDRPAQGALALGWVRDVAFLGGSDAAFTAGVHLPRGEAR
jgi:hypothetical protein